MPFNPMRLSVARQRQRLTRKAFADLVGVNAHTVTRWENGQTQPDLDHIAAFERILGFPQGFFVRGDVDVPEPGLVSFRSQRAMTASERDAALAAGTLGFEISDWVETEFSLPIPSVPDLSLYDPETAAVALRQDWGLGEAPVSNMIHLLESKGVRVFSLAENTRRVNAFSLWRDDKPFAFLNTMKTAENIRFDAAHELGHLVLHQDSKFTGRVAEDQANSFASAFLMPKSGLLAQSRLNLSIDHLMQHKKKWRVSLLAFTVRLNRLGLLSDWTYRDYCIQIRSRYGDTEPQGIERERSVVWRKVMTELWAEGKTQLDIAKALDLPESEVSSLIFGILHGGGGEVAPPRGVKPSLVKHEYIA